MENKKSRKKNPPTKKEIELANRLRTKRLENNLSLQEVADKLGVSKVTISRYETLDITNIPSDKIEGMAKLYDTTPAYLMGWEDTMSIVEKKDLINKINDARNSKNLSVNQVINEVGLSHWLNETSPENDILKVARFLNVSTQKNQYILSFKAERNDLKNFYDWFIENTCTLNTEEIKKLKLTISNILKLINKGD